MLTQHDIDRMKVLEALAEVERGDPVYVIEPSPDVPDIEVERPAKSMWRLMLASAGLMSAGLMGGSWGDSMVGSIGGTFPNELARKIPGHVPPAPAGHKGGGKRRRRREAAKARARAAAEGGE